MGIVRLTFSPPLHIRRRAALPVRERLSRLSGGCQWFPALHLHHTSVLSPTCYQPTHSAAGDGHYLKFLRLMLDVSGSRRFWFVESFVSALSASFARKIITSFSSAGAALHIRVSLRTLAFIG